MTSEEAFKKIMEPAQESKSEGIIGGLKEILADAKEIGGAMWDAGKPMFDHGRTEAAALLFRGDAHVMYMKGGNEQQGQDKAPELPAEIEKQAEPQQEQERGGRER